MNITKTSNMSMEWKPEIKNTSNDISSILISRLKCAICNSPHLESLYKITGNFPINLNCSFKFDDRVSSMSYGQCKDCGTIQILKLMPLNLLYGGGDPHNSKIVGNVWGRFFKFLSSIVEKQTSGKNVLEIGDPSGKMLSLVNSYKSWTIVEPNISRELSMMSVKLGNNINIIEEFFDELVATKIRFSDIRPEVIIHSHVFEHIYEPSSFLNLCWSILPNDGKMIFAIPNMKHIVEESIAPFFGLFFEHTVYMDENIVQFLLEKSNFIIESVYYHEKHSIIFVTKKSSTPLLQKYSTQLLHELSTPFVESFNNTLRIYVNYVNRCNEKMRKDDHEQYFIFGASYNTQMLLALGLDVQNIICILDNCESKHGKYLQGTKMKIEPPSIIKIYQNPCIILRNGYYTKEITSQLCKIDTTIKII